MSAMHLLKLVAAELLDPEALYWSRVLYRWWRKRYRPTKALPKPPPPPAPPKPKLTCGCYVSIQDISDSWAMVNMRRNVLKDWKVGVCSEAWRELLCDFAASQRYISLGYPKSGDSIFLRGGLIEVFEVPLLHRTKDQETGNEDEST